MVAEHPEGWQHIFEPRQLTLADRTPPPADQGVRDAALEEAAWIADEYEIVGDLTPGWPDGASAARRQIAAAIRSRKGSPS